MAWFPFSPKKYRASEKINKWRVNTKLSLEASVILFCAEIWSKELTIFKVFALLQEDRTQWPPSLPPILAAKKKHPYLYLSNPAYANAALYCQLR